MDQPVFLSSSSRLFESKKQAIQIRHQWGLKRFWRSEESEGSKGDVVASHLDLAGTFDDARDSTLADVTLSELGIEMGYSRSRALRGQVEATWRRLDYDRLALVAPDADNVSEKDQSDRARELKASIQFYRDAIVNASYSVLTTDSNSIGYGYRAHRLQLLMTRHIARGVDGQIFATVQKRRTTRNCLTSCRLRSSRRKSMNRACGRSSCPAS